MQSGRQQQLLQLQKTSLQQHQLGLITNTLEAMEKDGSGHPHRQKLIHAAIVGHGKAMLRPLGG
jgi:hypothetical protein